MSLASSERSKLLSFDAVNVPLDEMGCLLADVYLELPRNDRFIRYICGGEVLEDRQRLKIARHTNPSLFMKISDLDAPPSKMTRGQAQIESSRFSVAPMEDDGSTRTRIEARAPADELFEKHFSGKDAEAAFSIHFGPESGDFLKKPIAAELKSIFRDLVAPNTGQINLESSPIDELTQRLLQAITPEIENLRGFLKGIPQYITTMDDSAAITSIAVLFAIARGQSSRNIFKDLAYACLFMDLSLADFTDETWKTYYLSADDLSAADKKRVFYHPRRSGDLVQKRFKNLPDIVAQLILGHHELFNGKGFPRMQRSEMLAPLVRILALAVDVFEFMKRQRLQGEFCTISEAIEYYVNEPVEPHARRHGAVLCREVAEYVRQS